MTPPGCIISGHTNTPKEDQTNPPTWIEATGASLTGMDGVCYSPAGEWQEWQLAFSIAIQSNIIADDNPQGFLTINDLELAVYISHLHIFARAWCH